MDEIQRLAVLRKSHTDEQFLARRSRKELPGRIVYLTKRLAGLSADQATLKGSDDITIGGRETGDLVAATLTRPGSYSRNGAPPKFAVGDRVRARNIHPDGHTRLPRYARGKHGVIQANRGAFSFADSKARGDGPCPQHLYTVAFTAQALWGEATSRDTIHLDLWDSYLDPALSQCSAAR